MVDMGVQCTEVEVSRQQLLSDIVGYDFCVNLNGIAILQ